jgi:hypothetical protein
MSGTSCAREASGAAEPSVQEPAGVDIAGQNFHLALDFGDRSGDTMNMDWECPVGGQLWQRSCPFSFQGKTFQPDTFPGPW